MTCVWTGLVTVDQSLTEMGLEPGYLASNWTLETGNCDLCTEYMNVVNIFFIFTP